MNTFEKERGRGRRKGQESVRGHLKHLSELSTLAQMGSAGKREK
jgi:hypothetical protein